MVPATLYKTSKIQNIDLQDGGQNAAASAEQLRHSSCWSKKGLEATAISI